MIMVTVNTAIKIFVVMVAIICIFDFMNFFSFKIKFIKLIQANNKVQKVRTSQLRPACVQEVYWISLEAVSIKGE